MMKILRRYGFVLLGLGSLAFVTSCGKRDSAGGAARSAGPLPEPPLSVNIQPGVHGGRLVIPALGDPKTFNPITANESSSTDIIRFLFATLVNTDLISYETKPGLAESWTVADDKKTWKFKLRKGVRWADGKPLTAHDVKFTWDVIYNPKINNVTADLFRINGKNFEVTVLDDFNIQVVTPEIYAPFVEYFGAVPILPRHALQKAVDENRFEAAFGVNTPPDQVVGSGPYKLKQVKSAQHVLLERNPHYFAIDPKGQRLPYIDNLIFTVVPDINAMALRLLQGEADVFEVVRPDEADKFKEEEKKGRIKLIELGTQMEPTFVWFNQNTNVNQQTGQPIVSPVKLKWFRNQKFRQAMSHAIDRDSVVRSIYAGRAAPNYGILTAANKKWHNPNTAKYPYSIEKARALLAEIGIQDRDGDGILEDAEGNKVEFTLNTNAGNNIRERIAVFLQQDFKKLGVSLVFQPLNFNALVQKINTTYEYDAALLTFGSDGIDPASWLNVLKSSGFTHFWFPRQEKPSTEWEARIDELMTAQLSTLEYTERKKYFDEIQQILGEQLPMIPIVAPQAYAAASTRVANLRPTVTSSARLTWNADELYIKK